MNILKWYIFSVFSSSKYGLFHNSNVFGSCIIHILYTGRAKIKKNNSGAKRLTHIPYTTQLLCLTRVSDFQNISDNLKKKVRKRTTIFTLSLGP
jgi:hypothetical protein